MAQRIVADRCCSLIVDVQSHFLSQVDRARRGPLIAGTANLVRLLAHFGIPLVVTLERPLESKGTLPREIAAHLGTGAQTFEKDYFDLSAEETIAHHLKRLKRPQMILAGCETDVCILQSCLGLIERGYEVFVVEDLLFSSSPDVAAAVSRMQAAGAVFLTYKTLYYELVRSVGGDTLPADLPDTMPAKRR